MSNIYSYAIEQLQSYGKKLSKKALLVDKPWVLINEDKRIQKLIFKNNNELIISKTGNAQIGKWEYLVGAKSLLIDDGEEKILCNEGFLDDAALILKKDGCINNFFIYANADKIPDLNIINYLTTLKYKNMNLTVDRIAGGRSIEIHPNLNSSAKISVGSKVSQDLKQIEDGVYLLQNSKLEIQVKHSYIDKVIFINEYKTVEGQNIYIKQLHPDKYMEGDQVILNNNNSAPDRKYNIKNNLSFTVKNGVIYAKRLSM